MVKAASAPCLLGPGWGLWGRTTPSGRRGFGRPILKTPGSFSGVAVGRRAAVECMPDRYGSGSGFRMTICGPRREIFTLVFRFWSTKNRVFLGLISELVFANRVREHTTGPAAEPRHQSIDYTVLYVYGRRRGLALELLSRRLREGALGDLTAHNTRIAARRLGGAGE